MSTAIEYKASAKRFAKLARNFFRDPLPRNNALTLSRIAVDSTRVEFRYRARDEEYVIVMELPGHLEAALKALAGPALNQLLTLAGIAFSVFLFKLSDFAMLDVRTAPLDVESRRFFETFLVGGLAEFRFRQCLDPGRPIAVRADAGSRIEPLVFETENRVLMLNGGGKDTIVAAEILKRSGQPFTWLTIEPNQTRRRVIELSGVTDSIEVSYEIDAKVAKNQAYPWGHVPRISIVLSIGLLIAALTKARYVAVGNELSANYGNMLHRGIEVNHQYAKSFAFEKAFGSFAKRRVTSSVEVFSILRPFHDLQLAQLFAGQKRYLKAFISCNRGIAQGRWCKECPKCAFTALALRPFATAQEIADIFGEDVFQRVEIRKHILDLVAGAIKPWECVGTRDECMLGLALLLKQSPQMDFDAYPRRRDFEQALVGADATVLGRRILESTGREHMIPEALRHTLNTGLAEMSARRLRIETTADSGDVTGTLS